ncbi:MAG: protein kinase domain-containing protein [Candidatus Sumerlaeaceae bacterium]
MSSQQVETTPGYTVSNARVLTVVFTDLAGSTALKRKLGDAAGAERIARHQQLVRQLTRETEGTIVNRTGDGFLLTWPIPSQAVAFALLLQQAHTTDADLPRVRIGMHMGEVTELRHPDESSSRVQLEGFAVDLAARIQSLALPGQTLLSYPVFENARQRLSGSTRFPKLMWRSHGRYLFKGHDRPLAVFEVGIEGSSPLVPPLDHEKAHHVPDTDSSDTAVRWRPAPGLDMPRRPNWSLVQRLGSGGGGEVWLASQRGTGERRVFKFCFDHQQLRALQREVTVFRLLKETLGDRSDIARVLDWQFDEPPFYLEFEYVGGLALPIWADEHGGLANITLAMRLELVAQVADAVAAAHSVGILHKDIKPSNILVVEQEPGDQPQVRMIDFGIGLVLDRELLAAKGITALGMTQTASDGYSTNSGTRLYMAPELMEGQPVTTSSDIYSLGVVLYQIVIGNLQHALATGWQREISDELLLQDINACVDGRPERRLGSAAELARRLRTLDARRDALFEENQLKAESTRVHELAAKARQRNRWLGAGIGVMLLLLAMCVAIIAQEQRRSRLQVLLKERETSGKQEAFRLKLVAENAQKDAEAQRAQSEQLRNVAEHEQYFANIGYADANIRQGRVNKARELLFTKTPAGLHNWEWGFLVRKSSPDVMTLARYETPGGVLHAEYNPKGDRIATGDRDGNVTLYDSQSGRNLAHERPHKRMAWRLAWSRDGSRIGVAGLDHVGSVLDATNLRVVTMLRGSTDILRGVDFNVDGTQIATCGADRMIRIWDANSGKLLQKLERRGGVVYDLHYSPDGASFVTGSLDSTVDVWDARSGAWLRRITENRKAVHSVNFSPDGSQIMTAGSDKIVRVFDAHSTAQLQMLESPGDWMHCASYSTDGKRIATSDDSGICRVWDAETSRQLGMLQAGTQMYAVFFSPDGKRLITTNWDTVKLWDVSSIVNGASISPGGAIKPEEALETDRVICYPVERGRDWKNYDARYNVPSGQTVFTAGNRKIVIQSFFSAFSPDWTKRIMIDERTMRASGLDVRTSSVLAGLGEGTVYSCTFSPDGKLAATGGYRNIVSLYDPQSWRLIRTIRNVSGPNVLVSSLQFSPDSKNIFVGLFDGFAGVFDVASGTTISAFRAHQRPVLVAEFTPDGKRIATGSTDRTAKLFSAETGDQLTTMTGHTSYVHGISFNPDSSRLVTCSDDGTAKLWETDSGREVIPVFDVHADDQELLSCSFTRDGRSVYAATSKGTLLVADAYPWLPKDYPEADAPVEKRLELWKRLQFNPSATMEDIDW